MLFIVYIHALFDTINDFYATIMLSDTLSISFTFYAVFVYIHAIFDTILDFYAMIMLSDT
jgi:hypothetical protein